MRNSLATFQNKSVTSHVARAAQTRADAGQCGSPQGEPLMMMPLLTRCDAARLLPAAPRGQPLQSRFGLGSPPTVNRPPRNSTPAAGATAQPQLTTGACVSLRSDSRSFTRGEGRSGGRARRFAVRSRSRAPPAAGRWVWRKC